MILVKKKLFMPHICLMPPLRVNPSDFRVSPRCLVMRLGGNCENIDDTVYFAVIELYCLYSFRTRSVDWAQHGKHNASCREKTTLKYMTKGHQWVYIHNYSHNMFVGLAVMQ